MLLEKKAGENLEENMYMYIQTYHLSVEGFITRYLKQKNEINREKIPWNTEKIGHVHLLT